VIFKLEEVLISTLFKPKTKKELVRTLSFKNKVNCPNSDGFSSLASNKLDVKTTDSSIIFIMIENILSLISEVNLLLKMKDIEGNNYVIIPDPRVSFDWASIKITPPVLRFRSYLSKNIGFEHKILTFPIEFNPNSLTFEFRCKVLMSIS